MPYEIVNNKRSKSVIRVVGNTATPINLSTLSTGSDETVTAASITHISSQSDGAWKIYRGDNTSGVLVLDLTGGGNVDWPLAQYDISIANTSTSNIYVTNSGTGGTLLLTVSKTATYNPALTGL
jgi:hypothetical protein